MSMYDGKSENYARATQEQCVPADTPLERIAYFANRVESAGDGVDSFISRFRGAPPSCAPKNTLAGVPAGHEGNLVRLADQLDRLENLVAQLSMIG